MGSEAEIEASSTAKLPLFSVPPMLSAEPSGMLTPPLQTSASVPFRWEEEPGKPRPCTALITLPVPNTKCLELPPRLQQLEYSSKIITKTSSPTTVLNGPYVGKTVISSSSFRFSSKREESFESRRSRSPERVQRSGRKWGRGLFSSWGKKQKTLKLEGGKKEDGEGSFVFPSFFIDGAACDEVEMAKIRRNESLSRAKSHFWATMYEISKQAIPWKTRKSKKSVLIN